MAGKQTYPTITYSMDSAITISVKMLSTGEYIGAESGEVVPMTIWSYDIQASGRTVFKGNKLATYSVAYTDAALKALKWYMREDSIRAYDPEIKGGRGNWMYNVRARYGSTWSAAMFLDQIPGVLVENGDGVFRPLLDPDVPEVTLTSEIPDVPMDIVDPENEAPVTYPNIQNSLFSG